MTQHWPIYAAFTLTTTTAGALLASALNLITIDPPEAVIITGPTLYATINLILTHINHTRRQHAHHHP